MTSKKVTNPNKKSNAGFLWAIIALLVIGAVIVGYIVISGRSSQGEELAQYKSEINAEMEFSDNTITLSAPDAADAKEASLYEDFSCSYCAQLAEDTDEQMKDEIEKGNLTVHINPLNFLDNGNEGHSTQALAAALALAANGETDAYWSLRSMLMLEQQQVYNQWDNEDFATAATAVGASEESAEAIRNGEFLDEAKATAEANATTLQEQTGSVSSPRILQDGQDLPIQDNTEWIDYVLAN
ncbi:DsbA family protein [Corynebacterium guangdongense]|uniref:Protein-disulfide isomerase n=1 Tax=Corynebacterium guangdongense TaxID=1783348 RepID=A0ABU1ZZ57_9CORY|nr:thioredoxin domain-containing protein [Corynebacterium guangdongense]MDR7330191.1 protein-disulfide isomerase [Corynebacterium guangdongense]WJZ18749.1 hypothetical protein CGUA_11020 [Corynebacterium guangdongense]